MNKCILVGNLTRDPELTQTNSGISCCKFTLAVNRNYVNTNGEREADFINIVTWRGLADNCGKYLSKGSKIALCGQIQTRSYEDKDGNKRFVTEVVADDVEFINTSKNDAAEPKQAAQTEQMAQPQRKQVAMNELKPVDDDGLPF
ncbi:MAG: single-stranded DNA-binding protein [Clostridiales bacterium]|nr:single-stranded DNA-binding protein [Clostridiales bacterium]